MKEPSGPNSSSCDAVAPYAGPAALFDRVNTKTCPFEFTATPAPSPKFRSGGSLKKFGTESNGISGGGCCANAARLNAMTRRATQTRVTGILHVRTRAARRDCSRDRGLGLGAWVGAWRLGLRAWEGPGTRDQGG